MHETAESSHNFVSVEAFEVTCQTNEGSIELLIEVRKYLDGRMALYTQVEGQPVRAASLYNLLLDHPTWRVLNIPHPVRVVWNNVPEKAMLHERMISNMPEPEFERISFQLRLELAHSTYETKSCPTLQDARWELEEIVEKSDGDALRLHICHDCTHSWNAPVHWSSDDRDHLICYRDSPEAEAEVKQKLKNASLEAQAAGAHYVSAFHTCSAWQRRWAIPSEEP